MWALLADENVFLETFSGYGIWVLGSRFILI